MSERTDRAGVIAVSPLVELLRCLGCCGALRQTQGSDADTSAGELLMHCDDCGRSYPITNGTVRMLDSGETVDEEYEVKRRTGESFAYEWEHFGRLRESWLKNFTDYMQPHPLDFLRGKLILDVGAGSGRHSYQAHLAGARVAAVDIGRSIDVARKNLPAGVLTVQADAEMLPFTHGSFDIVMSIGVLHHLPDPERAFRSIALLARPGGIVHVYVYWAPPRRGHRFMLRIVEAARKLTTRMPHRLLHALCYPLAVVLFAAFVIPYRIVRTVPRFDRLADAFPLKAYADYPFSVCVNDQFDRFSAPLERRFTRDEIEDLFASAGLEKVTVVPNNGWVASGRRPEEASTVAVGSGPTHE